MLAPAGDNIQSRWGGMIGPYRWLFIIVRARPRLLIYLRNFVLCIVGCVPRQELLWMEQRGQDRFPFATPHFLPCSIALCQHVTCAAAAVLLEFNGSTALSVETSVCGAGSHWLQRRDEFACRTERCTKLASRCYYGTFASIAATQMQ